MSELQSMMSHADSSRNKYNTVSMCVLHAVEEVCNQRIYQYFKGEKFMICGLKFLYDFSIHQRLDTTRTFVCGHCVHEGNYAFDA